LSDTAVPKRMKTLYSSFAGRVTAYRQAMGDERSLAGAVARNVFPDEPQDERADALATYLKAATAAVAVAELVALRRGNVPFPPLASASREGRGA
jgi:cytochrome b pre-mRNA-processing protein 3